MYFLGIILLLNHTFSMSYIFVDILKLHKIELAKLVHPRKVDGLLYKQTTVGQLFQEKHHNKTLV